MLAACGSSSTENALRQGEQVAEVNGEAILTQDVEAWALEHSVDRDTALDALIDEALLVSEARRRGQQPDRNVIRRAAVQEILAEIEDTFPTSGVTSEVIRAEYESVTSHMSETNPDVEIPSLEDSEDEIRAMLSGRARLERLESMIEAPDLNEERVPSLLALPALD